MLRLDYQCDTVPNCPVKEEGISVAGGDALHAPLAGVAQLVEHLICNQRVRGSNPFASSRVERVAGARKAGARSRNPEPREGTGFGSDDLEY